MIKKIKNILIKKKFLLIFIALVIFSLVPIWIGKFFPSQDGPNHLYLVKIFKELLAGNPLFQTYFNYNFSFTANFLFDFITFLFSFIFDYITAQKIAISISILLFNISALLILKEINKKNYWIFAFATFILTYNLMLFMGFFNYYLSVSLFLLCFLIFIKKMDPLKKLIAHNILSFLTISSHLMGFGMILFTEFFLEFNIIKINIKEEIKKVINLIKINFISLIFLIYFFLTKILPSERSSGVKYNLITAIKGAVKRFFFSNGNTELVIGIVFTLIMAVIIIYNIKKTGVITILKENKYLKITAFYIILYLILPTHGFNWSYFNFRILIFIYLFSIFSIALFKYRKKILSLILIFFIILTIINFSYITYNVIKINKELDNLSSGIYLIEENKHLLPIYPRDYKSSYIKEYNREYNPTIHFWSYYCIEKNCISPYSFAGPGTFSTFNVEYNTANYYEKIPAPSMDDWHPTTLKINESYLKYDYYLVLNLNNDSELNLDERFNLSKIYDKKGVKIYKKVNKQKQL
jgi:hypothetical protein